MARSRTRYGDLSKVFKTSPSKVLNLIGHLSILFEDLRIEIAGVQAAKASLGAMDTLDKNYRKLYFVRRSLVTLSEVAGCIKAIAADSAFRENKQHLDSKYLQDIMDAHSYFSKRIDLINQFRNEFGGHLDPKATERAIEFIQPGTMGKVSFADTTESNFVLQVHFAETLLEAAILSKLKPGLNLTEEFTAVLQVLAESVRHTQLATQALVYGFLWKKFG